MLGDLAIYDSLPWDSANEPPGVTFTLGERLLWATHAASKGLKESASMPVADSGAAQVLRAEAKQLPRGEAGIVCIEMTTVVGDWRKEVRPIEYQLRQHSRVSAVVLFQRYLSLAGFVIRGALLRNPHAAVPVTARANRALRRLTASSRR